MRVLIVGRIKLYRAGLAEALAREPGTEVVGTASSGEDALEQIKELRPDVVLVDLMQEGADLIRALGALTPPGRVVALAVEDDEHDVIACAEAGVAGYVTREASFEDLAAAVRSAGRGETLASPRMTAALFRRVADLAAERHRGPELPTLTAREHEVMALVGRGLSNKEIARALQIEVPTVKNHIHHILEKLNVHRRSDAIARFRASPSSS